MTILYNSVVDGEVAKRRWKLQTNPSSFSIQNIWHMASGDLWLSGHVTNWIQCFRVLYLICINIFISQFCFLMDFSYFPSYFPQFCYCSCVHVGWLPEVNSWNIVMEFAYPISFLFKMFITHERTQDGSWFANSLHHFSQDRPLKEIVSHCLW